MDEIDLAAEREGQAIRTIRGYATQRPHRSQSVSRLDVSSAEKDDFMAFLRTQQDVRT